MRLLSYGNMGPHLIGILVFFVFILFSFVAVADEVSYAYDNAGRLVRVDKGPERPSISTTRSAISYQS